jgi:hypothetical protein
LTDPQEELNVRRTGRSARTDAREGDMARLKGLEPRQAGWFTRALCALVRRKVGKLTGSSRLVEPVTITAHHPRLLFAYGQMELGQEAARSMPAQLKALASIKTATLIGCPY